MKVASVLFACIPPVYGFTTVRNLSRGAFHTPALVETKVSSFNIKNNSNLWTNSRLNLSEDDDEKMKENAEESMAINENFKMVHLDTNKGENKLLNNIKTIKNVALSLLLVVFLTLAPFADQSLAVESGGRMGGSFSRPSQPSSSRMYSSPSRSYSRSYSYSSPTVITPYYSPSPFFNPFWGPRWGYGGGGVVVSRGPSFFDVAVFAAVAFALFSTFSKPSSSSGWTSTTSSALGPGFSVLQLSVALNVPDRDSPSSILSKLDYLAETARTDSRIGLQNLVSEVSLELLRNSQSVVSASSSYSYYDDYNRAQRDFNNLSVKERSKFQRETVSKYKGVDYSSRNRVAALSPSTSQLPKATAAVVTLVLCIEGDSTKIPSIIRSPSELQNALSLISSDSVVDSCLQGAEILWTPQDRMETLSMQDVVADYPNLRTI